MRQLKITKQITGRESYAIERYLQEIGKINLLSPEEEANLAKKTKGGDPMAKERLVLSNLRFVVSVAKQYQNHGLTLGDLINEGNMGLLKAVECFDETKGFKFISYAVWWIRQSILQSIAENARLIRLPQNKIGMMNKVNKCFIKLEQECQREPTAEEVAEELEVSPEEVRNNLEISSRTLSMDEPLNSEEDAATLYDVYIPVESELPGVDPALTVDSLRKDIERTLSVLSERESMILCMYYGLNGYPPMLLEEVGDHLNLTSERVRQVKNKAIRKLKETGCVKRLKTYL